MNPEAAILVLPASVAGALLSLLIVWQRKHPRRLGIRWLALCTGSFLACSALVLFARVFVPQGAIFPAVATILTGAWTALLHTTFPLPLPTLLLKVSRPELKLLRKRWTGIPLFGQVLRRTPLKHLGGAVYLKSHAAPAVRRGLLDDQAVHIWSVAATIPWFYLWIAHEWWQALAVSLGVHLVLNVYPTLHVRRALGRLDQCLPRMTRGKNAGNGPAPEKELRTSA